MKTLYGAEDQPFPGTALYNMAGTMSGQNVLECDRCGALVRESNALLHTSWHKGPPTGV